ncbi:MAG: hemerythrin domain-containing protein [Tepidimonas sp.]|uniref:bacteriohemerythrin n=1 Tax=Tepidimonas sp. TaxID=2002775 RepID=UPI00259F9959|nr:hemerythrin domain-containing protein [Tepidimonas sp.]MDM7457687.1 hemerythrin domain-containing protein [Tepidimonas sp.]
MDTDIFPEIPDLVWGESLLTGDGRMDETHEEFVTQLARLRALPHDQQLDPYRALLAHTVEHFEREERWMVAVGFAKDNCHAAHHRQILDTMRAVEEHFLQGDHEIIDRMAAALAEWFPMHAKTMDAGLAQHMRAVGFDSRTETLADPSRVRPATMTGCGSVQCS